MSEVAVDQRAYRLSAIDMLRGLAVVVMALDHVRVFFLRGGAADPMEDPQASPGLFFTRWITHFCAPVFVLLAGTSAGLMLARKSRTELGGFLCKRGLWLIVIEAFVIATAFTFAPFGIPQLGGQVLIGAQVIWAIGASMLVLAGAQFLGRPSCLLLGAAILLGHNALDAVWPASKLLEQTWPWWVMLHSQMALSLGPFLVLFVYPLLPWLGVMLLGFGSASVFELPAERRNAVLLRCGGAITLAFLLLRGLDIYGDHNGWQEQPDGLLRTLLDFLNTTKYGPSLAYLLMTLGPAAILCALADRLRGRVKDLLVMFGRVPFAFYVTHFFLIHTLSVLFGMLQGFQARELLTIFIFYPATYGTNLVGVYVVWLLVVALLYPLCRWAATVKARRRDWWLSYL